MKVNLQNKTALVTGASRGIGAEIAYVLAKNGAKVILQYHKNRAAVEKTFARLSGNGHLIIQANLNKMEDIENLVNQAVNSFESIDILVNNAGIYDMQDVFTADLKTWQKHWKRNLDLNLNAPVMLSFLIAGEMKKNGGGRIINISSRGAFRGEPEAPAYGAAKSALNSFAQSMAQKLAPENIFVYTIAPGFVDTDMSAPALKGPHKNDFLNQSPLKRAATPREIADVVLFCASSAPDYMTGCIIDVNGASYLRN
ncbi:MAG TPA: SDR family NAD(P)-dependent oxidoreductase [Bacteroidia bacterium]|nr:SDR family NAD(P)-dependent oxidoreductase [Bacteroidia bacterium]HRS58549.1 SDR family NAD(P)-dependent oxidoreductase [Bacteroidia bacterium]HRU68791.1 SDR family NAD(P)-dependent oxidoreductase [Bacteroidia bacterium]